MILALTNAAGSRYLQERILARVHLKAAGHSRLGADLESDTGGGRLGVVDGLGAGLDVGADAVVVARGEGLEVAETVEGDSVLGGTVAEGSGVAGDLTLSDVVRGLATEEEAVAADDGVSSEGGALMRMV